MKEDLILSLRKFAVVFAFSVEDLVRISPKVVEHRLTIDPSMGPMK